MRYLVVALCLMASSSAWAQSEAASLEDRPTAKVNEVERGIFFGAQAGGFFLLKPKGDSGSGFSPGRSIGLTLGSDIGDVFSVGVLMLATSTSTPSDYVNGSMKGDFTSLILGGIVRANLVGLADANGVKRFFVGVHGGAGVGLMGPKNFYSGNDVVVLGGAGLEYFTRLRHFSIGLDADFVAGLSHMGPGFMVAPNIRYAF